MDYIYYSNRVVIHCNKNHFELLDAVKMFIMCDYIYYSNRVVIHCNKNHFELLDAVKMFIMCGILQEILNGTRIMNIYIITLATTYVATVHGIYIPAFSFNNFLY